VKGGGVTMLKRSLLAWRGSGTTTVNATGRRVRGEEVGACADHVRIYITRLPYR